MKQPHYVLIDEPEIGLHPSLQLDFLTTLASYAPGGVLFATHSIGLARAAAQQVFAVDSLAPFRSTIRPLEGMPRLSEFLGEMSFGGYRELGFNTVILVKGPADVLALQQLLRLYGKEHKFLLLNMGGSSLINGSPATIIQLEEVKRIADSVVALVDSERDSPDDDLCPERAAFREACAKAKVECKILCRRATENYWTDSAVRQFKGPGAKALGRYENLKSSQHAWAKCDNWRIARNMTPEDLAKTDLGEFLESL